jgi:hypothetical protein
VVCPTAQLTAGEIMAVADRLEPTVSLAIFKGGISTGGFLAALMSMQVHNSALQALVEFGWIGGIALVALVLLSLARLLPIARYDDGVRFALCSLAYVAAISLAHGRSNADILLYALLGVAAGVYETYRTSLTGPR